MSIENITTDYYSDQLEKVIRPYSAETNRSFLEPTSTGGKVRKNWFSFTVGEDTAGTKRYAMAVVPKGARITGGAISSTDIAAAAGDVDATLGIMGLDASGTYDSAGTVDDVDFFLTIADVGTAKNDTFADASFGDPNAGYLTTKDVVIILVLTIGATKELNGTGVIKGFVEWLKD